MKRSVVARDWVEGAVEERNGQSTKDIQGIETILYDSIMAVDKYHYAFARSRKSTSPRMNPHVNCALRVMLTCQWRSVHCNKRATLVQGVDSGRGCVLEGRGHTSAA